jgi:SRSO17 transposase
MDTPKEGSHGRLRRDARRRQGVGTTARFGRPADRARFARSETRDRVRAYLVGLLAPVQRKNSWQLAERMGDDGPYGVQHLLGRSGWDPDEVRDDLRAYVVEALGDPTPS